MKFSALQIAQLIEGEIVGDPESQVSGLSKIEEGKKGTLSFLANPAYTDYLYSTDASVVIVSKEFEPEKEIPKNCTLIKVQDPYAGFAKLLEAYNQFKHDRSGISESAFVDKSAKIGKNVYIGPGVVIEPGAEIGEGVKIYGQVYIGQNVYIGEKTIIHPGVKIMSDCIIGKACIIQPSVVIGGDGFGFAPNSENQYQKVAQIGNVIVEDHVEIGSNTTIDRATLGSTIIRRGVKLDNLIQVAHNVEIGENTVIAAQSGIAGSTKIGRNCMIGGQVGIVGHIKIADGTKIAAQSGISASILKDNSIVQGSPAMGIGDFKKSYIGFKNLPQLMRELGNLKQKLEELKTSSQE